MHHDTELLETILGCGLGMFAVIMLDGYLKFLSMPDDRKIWLVLPMLFLGTGPAFFLAIERRVHEKTGRLLRFLHAICAATVSIYCMVFLVGIFLFVLGKHFLSYLA